MNVTGQERKLKECRGCPVLLPAEQTGVATPEKIQACIRRVLGDKRWWMTAEEFLVALEAHKWAHELAKLNPKPVKRKPAAVRDYVVNFHLTFRPKEKPLKREEVAP